MRILLCGASGMIGHALWRVFSGSHSDLLGTLHGPVTPFARYGMFDHRVIENFEASDFDAVTRTLDETRPAVILNCIGITKRKQEANELERMYQVNARFPHHLALWAARHGARVIHFSTDCVFDGADGHYSERSVVTAPDLYGQTKYFGEIDYDHCLTIRTSMIGRELAGFSELLEWFLAQEGRQVKGFKNALYSGVTTATMAAIVRRIIFEFPRLNGRVQIAGPVISKYDLLVQVRDAFGMNVEIVPDETFRCNRTLQSEKFAQAAGVTVPAWPQMIAALAADREFYDRHRPVPA